MELPTTGTRCKRKRELASPQATEEAGIDTSAHSKGNKRLISSETPKQESSDIPQPEVMVMIDGNEAGEIWAVAASAPVPGVCFYIRRLTAEIFRSPQSPLLVHETLNAALLATSTEAHDIALRSARTVAREYDPEIDTLFIADREALHWFIVASECYLFAEVRTYPLYAEKVKHLALALHLTNCDDVLAQEGKVVYRAPCVLPSDAHSKPLRLKKLLDPEDVTIEADYNLRSEHPGPDMRVRRTKNGSTHLDQVQRCLRGYSIDVWESKVDELRHLVAKKDLNIRCHASVLEVVTGPPRDGFYPGIAEGEQRAGVECRE
ncbi:hypothetical protein QBC35DRAFT_452913 [Podospora australis]|uniref:Uncharacterized protein n=1 Tax=Podospora australis TaxID=1536484 RepID=A0AAN6WSL8_9PEZI|nr:hypothetical protein QBC35DRAFT_452913 [Podospora australis]